MLRKKGECVRFALLLSDLFTFTLIYSALQCLLCLCSFKNVRNNSFLATLLNYTDVIKMSKVFSLEEVVDFVTDEHKFNSFEQNFTEDEQKYKLNLALGGNFCSS